MLTGSASATSPPFYSGDGGAIGVDTENNIKKTHRHCIPGGVTRRVRFRNVYDIGSSPLICNDIVSRIVKMQACAHWFGFCEISAILYWGCGLGTGTMWGPLPYATFNLCMLCTEKCHHYWQLYIGVQNERNKVDLHCMFHLNGVHMKSS